MKKRYIVVLIAIPFALIAGFFLWMSWIFVAFEHRENHNGVGYNAFRKSILRHVKQGPNSLSDMRSYEGTWWFTLTDQSSHAYNVTLGRDAFVDARDMSTLKYGRFVLNQIGGQELECENNYGERVWSLLHLEHLGVSENQPSSINAMLTGANGEVTKFGESLPTRFEIDETGVQGFPNGLIINLDRGTIGCGDESTPLEPPSQITCRLSSLEANAG